MTAITADGNDVLLRIKAVPGASRDELAGLLGDRIKVRVSAPAEGGKANKAICTVIARALGVKVGRVTVESGPAAIEKTIRISACETAEAERRLVIGDR